MGEYNLKDSDGRIVIDGHEFVHIFADVYKATDLYFVDIEQWRNDERNSGMHAVLRINDISDSLGTIKWVAVGSGSELNKFMHEVRNECEFDLLQTFCWHGVELPMDDIILLTQQDIDEEVD